MIKDFYITFINKTERFIKNKIYSISMKDIPTSKELELFLCIQRLTVINGELKSYIVELERRLEQRELVEWQYV